MASDVEIPCIDISPYLNSSAPLADRERVIQEVRQACERFGFLSIKGHGVPLQLQQEVLMSCKRLFDLPQEKKDALSLHNNPARRGYEKIGGQVLDVNALPDFKEARQPCLYHNLSLHLTSARGSISGARSRKKT